MTDTDDWEVIGEQDSKLDAILREIKKLRREVADVRAMLELSDIRKREEYIRRGVIFPFTPEQSKSRPGTTRLTSIL